MAGEITISLSVVGSKGGAVASVTASEVLTMTGVDISSQTFDATAAGVVIPVGATGLGGILVIKNMGTIDAFVGQTTTTDGVNTVAFSTTNAPIKIPAGETVRVRTNGVTWSARVTAGTCLLQATSFDA